MYVAYKAVLARVGWAWWEHRARACPGNIGLGDAHAHNALPDFQWAPYATERARVCVCSSGPLVVTQ